MFNIISTFLSLYLPLINSEQGIMTRHFLRNFCVSSCPLILRDTLKPQLSEGSVLVPTNGNMLHVKVKYDALYRFFYSNSLLCYNVYIVTQPPNNREEVNSCGGYYFHCYFYHSECYQPYHSQVAR